MPSLVAAVLRFVTLAGQGCGLLTRVLVPDALHDTVVAGLVEALRQAVAGWAGRSTRIRLMETGNLGGGRGPIETTVHNAVAAGAPDSLRRRSALRCTRGRVLFKPTILTEVTNDMAVAREEIFGPVIVVIRYSGDPDEGVRLVNDSPYGLVGAVWTADTGVGLRLASRIPGRAGPRQRNRIRERGTVRWLQAIRRGP